LGGRSHEWPDAILHTYEKEKELDDARAIQEKLLPGEIMQMAGYEIACAWQSARGVGGDYYDLIPLD
jgi:phosphoserine phosphatase RsbU/P